MMNRFFTVAAVVIAILTGGACATSRHLYLVEYEPVLAPKTTLSGKTIAVKSEMGEYSIRNKCPSKNSLPVVDKWELHELTPEEQRRWERDVTHFRESVPKERWTSVGWMRNGFGMHTADIYAMNQPSDWIGGLIRQESANSGATVIEEEKFGTADMNIRTTVKYLKIDVYMQYWVDLVIDVEFMPKGRKSFVKTYHVHANRTSWLGTSKEFFDCMRMCSQYLVQYLMPDIESVMAGKEIALSN
jgi:hypothetical protein